MRMLLFFVLSGALALALLGCAGEGEFAAFEGKPEGGGSSTLVSSVSSTVVSVSPSQGSSTMSATVVLCSNGECESWHVEKGH